MKRGLLGGTFDPIHRGHLELAQNALERCSLNQVLFIPAAIPPNKAYRKDLTEAKHRLRMVQLAVEGFPEFRVSDIELKRDGISYTVDTLRELRAESLDDDLFFIVGADTLLEIPTWKDPEEIRKLVTFLVAERPGVRRESPFADGVEWISMEPCNVSSTEMRDRVRRGESIAGDLPSKVADYICQMNLYKETTS